MQRQFKMLDQRQSHLHSRQEIKKSSESYTQLWYKYTAGGKVDEITMSSASEAMQAINKSQVSASNPYYSCITSNNF